MFKIETINPNLWRNKMYSDNAFISKTTQDFKLFEELVKTNITESSDIELFKGSIAKTYKLVKELYEEANCLPLSSELKLRNHKKVAETITENEIAHIVYSAFRKDVESKYITPLNENTLNDIYESEMDNVFKIIVKTNSDLDPEISRKYSIFEKIVKDSLKNIIIPKDSLKDMNRFVDRSGSNYFEVFDRTIREIKQELNEEINKLACNLAIRMFKKGIKFGAEYNKEDFELDKYMGLSNVFKNEDALDIKIGEMPDKIKEEDEEHSLDSEDIEDIISK